MNLGDIARAEVPSQRWALPTDSDYDIYGDGFETWVNDEYDEDTQTIAGRSMTYDEAMESDILFEMYVESVKSAAAEAIAERMMDDAYDNWY